VVKIKITQTTFLIINIIITIENKIKLFKVEIKFIIKFLNFLFTPLFVTARRGQKHGKKKNFFLYLIYITIYLFISLYFKESFFIN
jgi:hypothetical protein